MKPTEQNISKLVALGKITQLQAQILREEARNGRITQIR